MNSKLMTVKEVMAMMDEKRNGMRFGSLVISTMILDTEKKMDQWGPWLDGNLDTPKNLTVSDDFFQSLRG